MLKRCPPLDSCLMATQTRGSRLCFSVRVARLRYFRWSGMLLGHWRHEHERAPRLTHVDLRGCFLTKSVFGVRFNGVCQFGVRRKHDSGTFTSKRNYHHTAGCSKASSPIEWFR
ncbi:hypothetical protein BC830DRAFT_85070 [Chytriomyces sp. MP71]|nr:hypothetical protein BC830DRAFT_85070 [Chytriomyces sp. MP71]